MLHGARRAIATFAVVVSSLSLLRYLLLRPSAAAPVEVVAHQPRNPTRLAIAYSVYGSSPRYLSGALANPRLAAKFFPDWEVHMYHDDTVPKPILARLREFSNVRMISMSSTGGSESETTSSVRNRMSWRFLAASDPTVARFIVRDIDSRLSERDRAAVGEWIASGRKFHVMRDHPSHSNFEMSGGMWGGRGDAFPQMATELRKFEDSQSSSWLRWIAPSWLMSWIRSLQGAYMVDMNFLNAVVWPVARASVLQHDAFSCAKFGGGRSFPTTRDWAGGEHIGAVYIRGRVRAEDVRLLQAGKQPRECEDGVSQTSHPIVAPVPQRREGQVLQRPVIWANDFHISTIGNVKSLLGGSAVFLDKSLSGHCHVTNTCAVDLKVLTPDNAMSPTAETRSAFVAAYAGDKEFQGVDAVMCYHPSAMCELFLPLEKRLFVVASTRYEMARESAEDWTAWNRDLRTISKDARNVVAANNLYDAKYIEHFTGVHPMVLPSWIPMAETYAGTSDDVLVAAIHSPNADAIWDNLRRTSSRFRDLKRKYGHYTYAQLCENTAIVHFPYQTSVMSLFEQYGMGIPILVPTPEFLWSLHDQYDLVWERTWQGVRASEDGVPKRPSGSPIAGAGTDPDPNNDVDKTAFLHWMAYADYYQWPHIVQFDSWEALRRAIEMTAWNEVTAGMRAYHSQALADVKAQWSSLLGRQSTRQKQ